MANNNLYINYLNSLISKVYKILPMKEEQNTTTEAYISEYLQLYVYLSLLKNLTFRMRFTKVKSLNVLA